MIVKMFGVYVGTERICGKWDYTEAKHAADLQRRSATRPCLVHCFTEEWDDNKLMHITHNNSWQASAGGQSPGYTSIDIQRDEDEIRKKMAAGAYNPQF